MIPSPKPLTSWPPVAATACRKTEKYRSTHLVGVFRRHGERQFGRSDHVREENCQVLGGHAAPPGAPRRTGPLSYDRTLRRAAMREQLRLDAAPAAACCVQPGLPRAPRARRPVTGRSPFPTPPSARRQFRSSAGSPSRSVSSKPPSILSPSAADRLGTPGRRAQVRSKSVSLTCTKVKNQRVQSAVGTPSSSAV